MYNYVQNEHMNVGVGANTCACVHNAYVNAYTSVCILKVFFVLHRPAHWLGISLA